jgi:hypothetical protein
LKGWFKLGGPQLQFYSCRKRQGKLQCDVPHAKREDRKMDEKGKVKRMEWTKEELGELLKAWHELTENGATRPWRMWKEIFYKLPMEMQKIRSSQDLYYKAKSMKRECETVAVCLQREH